MAEADTNAAQATGAAAATAAPAVEGGAAAVPAAEVKIVDVAAASAKEGEAAPAAAEGGAKPHTETETLLETAAKEEAKPADAKAEDAKPGDAKAEDAKPGDKPAADAKPGDKAAEKPADAKPADAPIAYEFKFPETIKAEPGAVGELTKLFGEAKVAPEVAQKIVDIGTGAMQRYTDHLASEQHRVFGEMRADWRKNVMGDEQIGGSGHQTAMKAIARMRDSFVSTAKAGTEQYLSDMKGFNDFLRITGAGDHPAFLKMLHNVARRFDEPAIPGDAGKPPPGNGKPPKASRRSGLYDHPRSQSARS